CVEWVEQGTGRYTSPELYQAYLTIKQIVRSDRPKHLFSLLRTMATGGGMSGFSELADMVRTRKADMEDLIRQNGCDHNALQRFETNLIRFAYNKETVKLLGESSTPGALPTLVIPTDLAPLVKDLVRANSRTWAFKYIPNSVSQVSTLATDDQGRPLKVSATYLFAGFSGRERDVVHITFKNGVPDCILFPRFSGKCGTPDRKIIADYRVGKYRKSN
ncbi:MAG: hypothetical protein AAFN92_23110, partial [Bacteroidota bacterium]